MTDVQMQRAEDMWMSGCSITEIAQTLGFSYGWMSEVMCRNRDRFPRFYERTIRKPRKYTPLMRPLTIHELWVFKRMWRRGFLLSDIADSLGFAYTYLLGIIRENPEEFPRRYQRAEA